MKTSNNRKLPILFCQIDNTLIHDDDDTLYFFPHSPAVFRLRKLALQNLSQDLEKDAVVLLIDGTKLDQFLVGAI